MAGPTDTTWATERADAEKSFVVGNRSLAVDSSGHLHVAYGQDHLYYATYDGSDWSLETVDYGWGTGDEQSIALDDQDHPHISYYDDTNRVLKYATFDGATWQIETIDSTSPPNSFAYTSIAIDSSGHPHISYYDSGDQALKYTRYDGSQWQTTVVDLTVFSNGKTSLALDSADHPHISYGGNSELRYAHWNGSSWEKTTIHSQNATGQYTSLALDSNDRPHIAFQDGGNANLLYAHWTGSQWTIDVIDNAITWGHNASSIVVDDSDVPHVAYNNTNTWTVNYAYLTAGGTWSIDSVYAGRVFDTSLALSSGATPHVIFVNQNTDDLEHRWWGGSSWQSETVDRGATIGNYASLAMAPTAPYTPHVSYDAAGLRYAVFDGGEWVTETISSLTTLCGTTIALEPVPPHHPQIAFFDNATSELKYARWTGGAWDIDVVDSPASSMPDIGLALAPTAPYTPHITYIGDQDIRHAVWDGGTWMTETLETGGSEWYESWSSPAIAIDSQDRPHILYHGGVFTSALRYASWTGMVWDIETVSNIGNSYTPTALDLDGLDRPHILYVASYDDEVTYAYRQSGIWSAEVIEQTVSQYVSLKLDSDDQPHASYQRYDADELIYASRDGAVWTREVVDPLGGAYVSLDLDGHDHPRIAYAEGTDLKFAWKTVVRQVPATGGTMAAYDTADFEFSSGTLTETVTITCTVLQSFGLQPDVGVLYDIEATYTSTGQPASIAPGETYTVVVHYDQADVPDLVDEAQLALYYWDDGLGDWAKEPTSVVDVVGNTITATPSHFSVWAGMGEIKTVFLPLVLNRIESR
jgi:hypothetical protein